MSLSKSLSLLFHFLIFVCALPLTANAIELPPCLNASEYRAHHSLAAEEAVPNMNRKMVVVTTQYRIQNSVDQVMKFYSTSPVKDVWQTPTFKLKDQTGQINRPPFLGGRYSFDINLSLISGLCTIIISLEVTKIDLKKGELIFRYLNPSPFFGYQVLTVRKIKLKNEKEVSELKVSAFIKPKTILIGKLYPSLHRKIVDEIHLRAKKLIEGMR